MAGAAGLISKAAGVGWQSLTKGGAVAFGLNSVFALGDYRNNRQRGMNPVLAGAGAVAQTVLWTEFMLPMIALTAAPLLPIAAQALSNHSAKLQQRGLPMSQFSSPLVDSDEARTSRSRAIAAIQNSRLNARSYLGNEAGLYHARYR